ncbi:MAG: ABC transporter permease [Candidatus Geothermarchaeales archaeon]
MSNKALAICLRHFHQIWHRRKLAAFLIALPVLLMTLFGLALYDQRVPRGLDTGKVQSILEEFRDSEALKVVLKILKERGEGFKTLPVKLLVASVQSPTVEGERGSIFVVPGENTSIVFLDVRTFYYITLTSDLDVASYGFGSIDLMRGPLGFEMPTVDMQSLYSDENAMRMLRVAEKLLGFAIDLATGEEDRLLDLFFPEIVGIEIMWAGVLGASVIATEDRVSGARRRILMAPIPRSSFLAGTAMANFGLIAFQLVILFGIALIIFGVNVGGNPWDIIALMGVASFSMVGLGLIISHFSSTADEAFYLSTLVNIPMMFLSSTSIPLSQNVVAQVVAGLLPMSYANAAMREVMVNGASLSSVLPNLWMLIIIGALLYGLGMFLINRER